MNTIAICNQKGGIGKTTLCRNAGACLQAKGHRVLYIDLDPQQNLTYSMACPDYPEKASIVDVLEGRAKAGNALVMDDQGFGLIPSNPFLSSAKPAGNQALRNALEAVRDDFDYCLIDTPPTLGALTMQALTACNYVLIPALTDIYSLQGLGNLFNTLQAVKSRLNNDLEILGVVITKMKKTALARQMAGMMADTADVTGVKPFETTIRETEYINTANAYQLPICSYRPKSGGSKDYEALTSEILERIKEHEEN